MCARKNQKKKIIKKYK